MSNYPLQENVKKRTHWFKEMEVNTPEKRLVMFLHQLRVVFLFVFYLFVFWYLYIYIYKTFLKEKLQSPGTTFSVCLGINQQKFAQKSSRYGNIKLD